MSDNTRRLMPSIKVSGRDLPVSAELVSALRSAEAGHSVAVVVRQTPQGLIADVAPACVVIPFPVWER